MDPQSVYRSAKIIPQSVITEHTALQALEVILNRVGATRPVIDGVATKVPVRDVTDATIIKNLILLSLVFYYPVIAYVTATPITSFLLSDF